MKNKNHQNIRTAPKTVEKNNPFLESLKKCCSVISERLRGKAQTLPNFLLQNAFAILFFIFVWALLAFYEDALLFRVNELSIFLYDDLYYEEMMSAPAGLLSYVACYLVQFFYNPIMGATIYVALLALVYWLTCKVFDVSHRYRLFAMLPVVALLASNTQLGYWIFYLKLPGYYYVALLGVIVSLLAAWLVKKSHLYLKPLLVATWMYFAYPYIGVYAILSGVVMGVHSLCLAIGRKYNVQKIVISSVSIVVSVVMYKIVPGIYYTDYTTVPSEEMLTVGLPASQWKSEHVPNLSEKEAIVSFVADISGRVGYPTGKELNKFKMNVDAAFSEKAIKSAKDGLYSSDDINKPVDGKKYTFTFVGKDGLEYYLDYINGGVSFVPRNGRIPQSGFFLCDIDSLSFTSFKTMDGKFLSWNVELPSDIDTVELPSDSMQVIDAVKLLSDSLALPCGVELSPDTLQTVDVVGVASDSLALPCGVELSSDTLQTVDVAGVASDSLALSCDVKLLSDTLQTVDVAGVASDSLALPCDVELLSDTLQTVDVAGVASDSLALPCGVELLSDTLQTVDVAGVASDSLALPCDAELSFESQLSLGVERDGNSVPLSVGVVASINDGNTRCLVERLKKEEGVNVDENSRLFGFVNLYVFGKDIDFKGYFQPSFVVGFGDGALKGCRKAFFNNSLSTALRIEEVGFAPAPISLEMTERSMWYDMYTYWIPFWILLATFAVLAIAPAIPLHLPGYTAKSVWSVHLIYFLVALWIVAFSYFFWYRNDNFCIENKQNRAMWNEDWEQVAGLAKEADEPTRQVVMNKNIALLKLGRSGDELFAYPEGSADIEAPVHVRLTQTGGKMAYYQYGKFNFCYRWCVEDAVEYGWSIEYLKHAVRSMILSGEYKLAKRYVKILKRTKYYADWAGEMERYINDPTLIKKQKAFEMPLAMSCYNDALDVDESYVEAYLMKNLANVPDEMSRTYIDAAIASVLTRKDSRQFCYLLNRYVGDFKVKKLPKHYQEAALLFYELETRNHSKLSLKEYQDLEKVVNKEVSMKVKSKIRRFMSLVSEHKGKSETEMAPYFKDDFGDTYFYFYFFVRNIKTN